MPSHVANRISGPGLGAIKAIFKGGKSEIDFNRLVPMPDSLDMQLSGRVLAAVKFALRVNVEVSCTGIHRVLSSLHPLQRADIAEAVSPLTFKGSDWDNFIRCLENKKLHGEYSWYEWCPKHWGTKWNAYQTKITDSLIYFETAWSCPVHIVRALATKLTPQDDFVWKYASEDIGRNFGIWTFCKGDLQHTVPTEDAIGWSRAHSPLCEEEEEEEIPSE